MARIALKVDVDTLRGTVEGVPRLVSILGRRGINASFLFSLGPDHTGWALRRVFRPGFLSKVSRTSVLKHYGFRTLMYGVLLPAPDIGLRGAAIMRSCRTAGHECGIHTWDHVVWQDNVREANAAWTHAQMDRAYQRFGDIFGDAPSTHGAAGWQMNEAALKQLDSWGMAYASDGRGTTPYRLKIEEKPLAHVQLPTTLPTIDELVGTDGINEDNVVRALLSRTDIDVDQVFTLHAELEGGLFASAFEDLLDGWMAQGHQLMTLASAYRALAQTQLPLASMTWGEIPGRSGELMIASALR